MDKKQLFSVVRKTFLNIAVVVLSEGWQSIGIRYVCLIIPPVCCIFKTLTSVLAGGEHYLRYLRLQKESYIFHYLF